MPCPRSILALALGASALLDDVAAFSTTRPSSAGATGRRSGAARLSPPSPPRCDDAGRRRRATSIVLFDSVAEEGDATDGATDDSADDTEWKAAQTRETPKLDAADKSLVNSLFGAGGGDPSAMENAVAAALDAMHPRLVVALQMAAEEGEWNPERSDDDDDDADEDPAFESRMVAVGRTLQSVLDGRLRSGRELLSSLLDAGEIRKLDAVIGKAAKEGKLDMSFFTVLNMNMKDAAVTEAQNGGSAAAPPTLAAGEGQPAVEGEEGRPAAANRLQILQHVYTRAQEELEKNVAPGIGLLNKLLRTEVPSIRANQLEHYLCPQKTSITSPDGKTIELGGSGEPLVGHGEFTEALEETVTKIRMLEASGGTDRLSAANLVESVRKVAMEARVVLVQGYGEGSDVVQEFQRELQPVFRPGSKVP